MTVALFLWSIGLLVGSYLLIHYVLRLDQSKAAFAAIGITLAMVLPHLGFTKDTGCKLLVWFDAYDDLQEARRRELQMKEWKRPWKIKRIEERNLDWIDLYPSLFG